MAIATFSQKTPVRHTQEFTQSPPSSTGLNNGSNNKESPSVLAQNVATSSANSTPSPIFTPECTYQTIPYKTIYKTAAWLNEGQAISSGGIDGEQKVCSSQSGPPTVMIVISPLDKTVTTGTYKTTSYTYPPNSDEGDNIPNNDHP
jgi:hypothetical protein